MNERSGYMCVKNIKVVSKTKILSGRRDFVFLDLDINPVMYTRPTFVVSCVGFNKKSLTISCSKTTIQRSRFSIFTSEIPEKFLMCIKVLNISAQQENTQWQEEFK